MTDTIFHTDAYVREFEATITGRSESGVVLDRTAFFPGGGGQPADRGHLTIDGADYPVVRVERRGNDLVHVLDGSPAAGATRAQGQLDWEHRYALMRTHTAMHILCGVIWRDWQCQVTGSNMKPLEGRMDFEFEGMPAELATEIVRRANLEVDADREVKVDVLPRAEAFGIPDLIRTKINLLPEGIERIRTIEIVGLDLQADGGTHVHRTGEVGHLRLVKHESKGKINKRMKIGLDAGPAPTAR